MSEVYEYVVKDKKKKREYYYVLDRNKKMYTVTIVKRYGKTEESRIVLEVAPQENHYIVTIKRLYGNVGTMKYETLGELREVFGTDILYRDTYIELEDVFGTGKPSEVKKTIYDIIRKVYTTALGVIVEAD